MFLHKWIYIYKDESKFVCVCVCALRLKRGSRTVGAKNSKKYPKNAPSWIMEGRSSDRPDRELGNPLKPVGTRDDVGKNLVNAIVARFRRIFPTLRGRFPSIRSIVPANPPAWRHDQNIFHFSVCVSRVWKGESAPWGLKIWKNTQKMRNRE